MNAHYGATRFFAALLLLATALNLSPCPASAALRKTEPFRIAYVEAGPYWEYASLFNSIKKGLQTKGWDDRVVFPPELTLSLDWGEESRKLYREKVRELLSREDIDLVLSLGTEATLTVLRENPRRLPVVAGAITNPLDAGIIKSPTDSGADNLTTCFNPLAGRHMFITFHSLVDFKKLGIMYEKSEQAKTYAFTSEAIDTGRDLGFEVLVYDQLSAAATVADCARGVRELHQRGADAIFISEINCFDLDAVDPSPIYDYLDANRIPTFSASDRAQVRNFAMMGLLLFDIESVGLFQAGQVIDILNGASPHDLSMLAPVNYRLLINLEVAEKNGMDLPMDVLIMADEIFLKQERLERKKPGEKRKGP